jgi:putative membrane protein
MHGTATRSERARIYLGRAQRRMTQYQVSCLILVFVTMLLSAVHAPYPDELRLQHIPTVAYLIAMPLIARRFAISDFSASCFTAFMLLHILGARYLYSNVPYDAWTQVLFGWSLSARYGFERNHYDRVCHFAFGFLWAIPVWELLVRHFRTGRTRAAFLGLACIMAFSASYEIIEWGLTIVLAPQDADSFNGQQGDMWDPQKDMFGAFSGALLAFMIMYPFVRRHYTPAEA